MASTSTSRCQRRRRRASAPSGRRSWRRLASASTNKRAPETEETESDVRPKRTPETEETSERSDKWALETEETKLGVRSVGVCRSFAARHNGCDA